MAVMGRPKKREVREPVTAAVLPAILQDLNEIAHITDRSRSYIVEKMLLRGIAAFRRDGLLDEALIPESERGVIVVEKIEPELNAPVKSRTKVG